MKDRQIFKVQVPLSTSTAAVPFCLVYPQSRSPMFEIPYSDEIKRMVGRDLKMYVDAEVEFPAPDKPKFNIFARVKAQDW